MQTNIRVQSVRDGDDRRIEMIVTQPDRPGFGFVIALDVLATAALVRDLLAHMQLMLAPVVKADDREP